MWFTDQWFEMASLQELPFIWITVFRKGTLGHCCKHLPGSEMLRRWTRKVGWPKPTMVFLPDKVKSMTWKRVSQEAQLPGISFIVCLPTHLTCQLRHVLQANCPSPLLQCTLRDIFGGKFTQHVPYQLKFRITSPMLPCQMWANTTFKSPSNPRNQLTMIPLWFLLDRCPTIMF